MIKFIFGDNGDINDINSAESLWKAIHDKKKFSWGDEILKNIEEKFINDPQTSDKINKEDFPCELYK